MRPRYLPCYMHTEVCEEILTGVDGVEVAVEKAEAEQVVFRAGPSGGFEIVPAYR
ncbi:MAG: hypothetical protein ACNA8L_12410 [Luteolibacter sp.]